MLNTATIAKEEIKEGSWSRTPSHINWDIFPNTERDPLRTIFNLGRHELLTSVIPGVNLSNEKEIEIQKMVDYLQPKTEGFESKYKKQVDELVNDRGHEMSREEEIELDYMLEQERDDWIAKKEGKQKERNAYLGRKEEEVKQQEKDEKTSEKRIEDAKAKAEKELPPPPPEPLPSVQESLAEETIEKNVEATKEQAEDKEVKKSKKTKK